MIKIENYCKPGITKPGIPGIFDDEIEGKLNPCPLCKRIPKPMVRTDFLDGYFAAVSCFGGKGMSHAYVKATGFDDYKDVLNEAITKWNDGEIELRNEQEDMER